MKRKINKFLNKKITILNTIICMLLAITFSLGILALIIHPFSTYSYVTYDDEWGESDRCYKYKRKLVCEVREEVQQYYKK